MNFKVGDWVTILVVDFDSVPVGTVGQVKEVGVTTRDSIIYYDVFIKNDTYPYYEEELRLATELEKALA